MPLTKVSADVLPGTATCSLLGGNRGKKCWDLKSNIRTPKHVSIPHTRGRHPQYF